MKKRALRGNDVKFILDLLARDWPVGGNRNRAIEVGRFALESNADGLETNCILNQTVLLR